MVSPRMLVWSLRYQLVAKRNWLVLQGGTVFSPEQYSTICASSRPAFVSSLACRPEHSRQVSPLSDSDGLQSEARALLQAAEVPLVRW